MGLGRAQNWYFNPVTQAWELRGKTGKPIAQFGEAGLNTFEKTATIANVNVGSTLTVNNLVAGGGGAVSFMDKIVGSIALAAIGTAGVAVATVAGLGSASIAVGDIVSVNPKAAISGIGLAGVHVPTTNVVNVYVVNPSDTGGGSLPAVGVDVLVARVA